MPLSFPLKSSGGIYQSLVLIGGNVFSTGLSAVSIILLSRFMGPAAFGAFSLAFALSQVVTKLFDLGFNQSLQKYLSQAQTQGNTAVKALVQYGLKVKLLGSLLLLLCSFLLIPVLTRFLHLSGQNGLVAAGLLLGLVVYWFDYLGYVYQALSRFGLAAGLSLIQAALKLTVSLYLIFTHKLEALTAYLFYGFAPVFSLAFGLIKLQPYTKPKTLTPKAAVGPVWRLTRYMALLTVSTVLADYLDILLVQRYTETYSTGLYSAAARITLLLAVVAISLNNVLNTRVAKYYRHPALLSFLKKALVISGLSLLAIFLVLPFSRGLLLLTSGPAYLAAEPALKYLLASGMVLIATAPLASFFYGVEFPLYFAVIGLTQILSLVIFNLYLIPLWGITGAGQARLLMRLAVLIVTLILIVFVIKRRRSLVYG